MKTKLKQQALSEYLLNNSMARQAIINGNFDVWQRGTSLAVTSANAVFLADRWRESANADGGTNPTLTRSRQILDGGDIQNSFYYSRLTTNGAGSAYGNKARHFLLQPIEFGTRYLCGAGKKVTLSFWARSSIANKKIGIRFTQKYGTGGSPSASEVVNGTNWTLTSTWQKYTHTFETNTLSGKTFGTDNNDTTEIMFYYMWGTTYASQVDDVSAETFRGAGNIDIAQVQLCAGEVALPFMPKSFTTELADCMRYYEKTFRYDIPPGSSTDGSTLSIGRAINTVDMFGLSSVFKVKKRTTPIIKIYSYNGTANKVNEIGSDTDRGTTITEVRSNTTSVSTLRDSGSGYTTGNFYWFHWTAEAEL